MRLFGKAALMAAALAMGGCASVMGGPHRHGMNGAPMSADGGARHGMHGPMGGMTPLVGCRGARDNVEAQLTSLRASLRITSAQEGAWSAYDAAFRAHAGHMGTGGMGGDGAAAIPVVERLRRHEAMMSQHLASFQALSAAIESLYESLSAEQKAAADALRCHRPF